MRLLNNDYEHVESLRVEIKELQEAGKHEEARYLGGQILRLINQVTIDAIKEGDLLVDEKNTPTETLSFVEIPAQPCPEKRGISLELSLIEGSALTQEILAILERYKKGS